MRNISLVALVATSFLVVGCGGAGKPNASQASPSPASSAAADTSGFKTDDEKTLYAMGYNIGKGNFTRLQATGTEADAFAKGLRDGMTATAAKLDVTVQDPKIQALVTARSEKAAAAMKEKGLAYQKTAAAEPGAEKLPSGVVFRSLSPGSGGTPSRMDSVKVNYVGTFVDGTKFDASADHGGPATFQLSGVVPCFAEGISRMKIKEKARLVCPPEAAYGDKDSGPIPGGSTLVFDVELVAIGVPGKLTAAPQTQK